MEVLGSSQNKKFVLIAEVLGTMFLLISINWGAQKDTVP